MSTGDIDRLCDLWGHLLHSDVLDSLPPFTDHRELHKTIDATPLGDVKWDSFKLRYNSERPSAGEVPPWMDSTYEFWFRPAYSLVENMLSNMDFCDSFDYVPYRDFSQDNEKQQYENFISGDWAWIQVDKIAEDQSAHGSAFVLIILGSDKMTVSVATGQNDYWPVYLSIGNIHNNVRRAHCNRVEILAFLAIPKVAEKYDDNPLFRHFKKQLFHVAMSRILSLLKPGMTAPQVMKCPDRHFCQIAFGLGPYITDYPEQVLVSGIVQNWCGRCTALPNNLDGGGALRTLELTYALIEELSLRVVCDEWGIDANIVPFTDDFPHTDIRQLLAPDILHQLVKGVFKDHLVEWVGKYLEVTYRKAGAKEHLADTDHCITTAPLFAGLCRFPDGRGFSQWTGDDLKALMKVYLLAIEGHVPDNIVRTLCVFLEFCYIIRRNVITDDTLVELNDALEQFHQYREVFRDLGLAAARADLEARGMLPSSRGPGGLVQMHGNEQDLGASVDDDDHTGVVDEQPGLAHSDVTLARCPARRRAKTSFTLAVELGIPSLPKLIGQFLFEQLHPASPPTTSYLPPFTGRIKVFHLAIATFVAPSGPSGIGSMQREYIRAMPSWGQGPAHYDCGASHALWDVDGLIIIP
ncbi:hypothetical protein PAXINDRAFT_8465 [Paxillus involutus ATCC 200175]|nr:hypothetical protein PAXINDRAFT_8465 [Paxillus involutus ATCC 200175]